MEVFRLIEIWVTPGNKNNPETRKSRHTYFQNRNEAFAALDKAEGDIVRLLENVSTNKQVWHQKG